MKKIFTLCIVHRHPKILLGFKKKGFGKGRWNGFGGKVQKGETPEIAAKRELQEEAGVSVQKMKHLGILGFQFESKPEILEVHIFKTRNIEGEPRESKEMKPQWFHVKEIPFDQMWPDDRYWFPLLLKRIG